jgi:hypothetical protein
MRQAYFIIINAIKKENAQFELSKMEIIVPIVIVFVKIVLDKNKITAFLVEILIKYTFYQTYALMFVLLDITQIKLILFAKVKKK